MIGNDVWIGARAFIASSAPATITIGSRCDLGPGVMLVTGSHEIDALGARTAGRGTSKAIAIGEGCWLGARVTVLQGVELARKTLVAAGSVVVSSVREESVLLAGVPAAVKKTLR